MRNRLMAAGVLWCSALSGQSYEAASVKPVPSSDSRLRPRMTGGPDSSDPGQITYTNVTLAAVMVRAYDVKTYQVTGPDWIASLRYHITAKIPPGASKQQFQGMLQNLLTERFHLVLHHETRDFQGFELAAARGGPKLKPSTDTAAGAPEPDAPPKTDATGFPELDHPGLAMMEGVRGKAVVSFLTARAQPLSALVEVLSREFRMPIVDNTGLAGKFDFKLEFAPQPPGALDTAPPAEDSGPNLTSAIQQQLGLKLNPRKVPLDVLVIDSARQVPSDN